MISGFPLAIFPKSLEGLCARDGERDSNGASTGAFQTTFGPSPGSTSIASSAAMSASSISVDNFSLFSRINTRCCC